MRSVRASVPDPRVLERGFHDVTIVDMGDLPESSVSIDELSLLRRQWPPTVIRPMGWLQQDLDTMRAEAKKRFRNTQPGNCSYSDKWIKCDMYRHVATYHLDLGQLWRCPVSWCTVCKGTPQDCMDHVRGAHDVPWDIKSASLEKFVPRGWFSAKFGQIRSKPIIPGYRLTCSCLAISAFRWLIIIGCISVCSRILLSKGITCLVCESLCHKRRPGLGVIWCLQFSPVQCRCAMLALLSWIRSRPGKPDVPVAGCGQYESLRNQSVSNLRL